MLQHAIHERVAHAVHSSECRHCQALKDRIDELKEVLGDKETPAMFGLTKTEWQILSVIASRTFITRDNLYIVVYGDRPEASQPEIKIIDVRMCAIRRKMRRVNVIVETVWGRGFRILPECQKRFRELTGVVRTA